MALGIEDNYCKKRNNAVTLQHDCSQDMDNEYLQCSSCLKSNEDDVNIFRIVIGKNYRQTTCIKLCEECMRDLKIDMDILEINGKF